MREVQASDAKTHLPQLLDDVERGETIVINRHGRPIARIVPEVHKRREEIDKAIDSLMALRKRTGKMALRKRTGKMALRKRTGKIGVDEPIAMKHEGHRF
jgi:prevent-host-death family protein